MAQPLRPMLTAGIQLASTTSIAGQRCSYVCYVYVFIMTFILQTLLALSLCTIQYHPCCPGFVTTPAVPWVTHSPLPNFREHAAAMQTTENQNRDPPCAAPHSLPSSLRALLACFSRRPPPPPSPSPLTMAHNMHHSNVPLQHHEQQGRRACVAAAPAGSSMGRSQDLDADPESLPVSSNLDNTLAARKQRVVDAKESSGSAAAFPVVRRILKCPYVASRERGIDFLACHVRSGNTDG